MSGDSATRSEQYGHLAATQIAIIRDGYERAFAAQGVSWAEATAQARGYLPAIETHLPDLVTELRGIATGSGLGFDEILTINCRTEILHRATVASVPTSTRIPGECSSFAFEGDRVSTGAAVIGQNWDWLAFLQPGTVILEVERPDLPNYVTLVEAGLLGKITLTASGLALGLNTLVTSLDGRADGVPFHCVIRALADSPHIAAALETVSRLPRASSGNYLLAGSDGAILNLETSPGGPRNVRPQVARDGALFHTNHFLDRVPGGFDLAPVGMSDSFVRFGRIERRLGSAVDPHPDAALRAALIDHVAAPNSVCCHPDPSSPEGAQWTTIASTILTPATATLEYTAGPPCESTWNRIDYTGFFA